MKSNLIIAFLAVIFAGGACVPIKYLPKPGALDTNQYGSYIDIKTEQKKNVRGELIAVDNASVSVLTDSAGIKKIKIVPAFQVRNFNLKFANPPKYGWYALPLALGSISHGVWYIFSLPVNLISIVAISSGAHNQFSYNDKKITFEQLRMFARFPQGVPPAIDIQSIK